VLGIIINLSLETKKNRFVRESVSVIRRLQLAAIIYELQRRQDSSKLSNLITCDGSVFNRFLKR